MNTNLLFLHALSPLHAGTGQGVGVIDLPIAREKATNLPIVPGSTIKGVLRANCEDETMKIKVFGPDTNGASDHAGSAQFSDLRLLFLPVRSLSGTFAWVTSPLVLRRYQRDCKMANKLAFGEVPEVANENTCLLAENLSSLTMLIEKQEKQVVLEDLRLTGDFNKNLQDVINGIRSQLFTEIPWQDAFSSRVCVVHDNVLAFLLETATEVAARIRIKENEKTVDDGALWYEEALPAESILVGLMTVQEVKDKDGQLMVSYDNAVNTIKEIAKNSLQVGGKSTVGRGLCNVHLV
ncbi:MAG: type III-B CRISPR module RAMP protein Cmr4 [Anaerolineales bacterium]